MKSIYIKLLTNRWSTALAVKTTFFTLHLSNINPEGEVSSLKINRFMTNYVSNLKWAWQAQFLRHILVILKNNVFLKINKWYIVLSLFDTSTRFRFPKNLKSCTVQIYSHPWMTSHTDTAPLVFSLSSRLRAKIWTYSLTWIDQVIRILVGIFQECWSCLETLSKGNC